MDMLNISNDFTQNSQMSSVRGVEQSKAPKELEQSSSPKSADDLNKENKEEVKQSLKEAVKNLNAQMDMLNTNIKFGFNDKIEALYVNVLEKSSGKLIRKFPTEEAMKLAEHMKEFVGMLFDKKG